ALYPTQSFVTKVPGTSWARTHFFRRGVRKDTEMAWIRLSCHALIATSALVLGGCATKPVRVELHSYPLGAEVRTPKGEVLGLTPLVLEGETLKHAAPDGRLLSFSVDAQGYVSSQHTI